MARHAPARRLAPATLTGVDVERLDAEIREILRARGMRVTSPRVTIHRLIREKPAHFSAEDLHHSVAEVLPGVSTQTIYATLALFEELGLVRRVLAMSGAAMFDSRPDPHHHTSCRGCGAIADLEAPAPMDGVLAVAQDAGFRPDGASVTVVGLCAACAARGVAGLRRAPLAV